MNKRGASHIEVILAFVIFIGIVSFALYFFNPTTNNDVLDSTLSYSFNEVIRNTTSEVRVYSVVIKKTPGKPSMGIELNDIEESYNVRVENYSGKVLKSSKSGQVIYVEHENERFLSVMVGEDFSQGAMPSSDKENNYSNYEISSSNKYDLISEKRIKKLKLNYDTNYSGLKDKFNLPKNADFSFILSFSENDQIIAERDVPNSLEVFSDVKREKVLRENGEVVYADLFVKVW